MREIKFRAVSENKLFNVSEIRFLAKGIYIEAYSVDGMKYKAGWLGGMFKSMIQYTGLTDKNGKEIYEEDILHLDKVSGDVVFQDGAYRIDFKNETQKPMPICQMNTRHYEIRGNIYENPELENKGEVTGK